MEEGCKIQDELEKMLTDARRQVRELEEALLRRKSGISCPQFKDHVLHFKFGGCDEEDRRSVQVAIPYPADLYAMECLVCGKKFVVAHGQPELYHVEVKGWRL